MKSTTIVNPYEAVFITTLLTGVTLAVLTALYYSLKSKRTRVTPVYLSGEPESVVVLVTPSIASLYWGFMKKFAKSLYDVLVNKVHTGSLHDWYKFLTSWLSLLLILAILIFTVALVVR